MIVLCLNEVLYIIGELACFLFAGHRYGELVF